MINAIELVPDPFLLESMRAVGYTADTAVADVVDNSLAAGSTTIDVLASGAGDFRISVLDDGSGMDRTTALDAMRLAAHSPGKERSAEDLGRFGLGLKTASLSQCRRLTVATRTDGVTTVLRWDLDHVATTGRWEVLELGDEQTDALLGWSQFQKLETGTLVTWDNLDLFAKTEGDGQANLDEALVRVRSHCELVFHRFVAGDGVRKVALRFNGTSVGEVDPFLRRSRATQRKEQVIRINQTPVKVQAFTLPYISKMKASEKKAALAHGGLRDSQGFYIYRAGRLVIWGTWFRLNPKSEMGKLARVQVDIPNTLDHLWALDIKKSQAMPPREVKEALRNLAKTMIVPSTKVQKFRGFKVSDADSGGRLWNLVTERDREFRYTMNREHPLLRRFAESLDPATLSSFGEILSAIEGTFPVVDAHNRLSEDSQFASPVLETSSAIDQALTLRSLFASSHPDDEDFLAVIRGMEPFVSVPGFEGALRAALANS